MLLLILTEKWDMSFKLFYMSALRVIIESIAKAETVSSLSLFNK